MDSDALVIRERNNGNEGRAVRLPIVYEGGDTPVLDEAWWEASHEMSIEVYDQPGGVKGVNILIDGNRLVDPDSPDAYTYLLTDKVPEDARMYLGLRTWNDDVSFTSLRYEPLD